ncbi:hypothetical protein ACU4GD_25010 [Cupriavidus basilensis]
MLCAVEELRGYETWLCVKSKAGETPFYQAASYVENAGKRAEMRGICRVNVREHGVFGPNRCLPCWRRRRRFGTIWPDFNGE